MNYTSFCKSFQAQKQKGEGQVKKGEILKKRRILCRQAGKSEYFFFTSILISAMLICVILVLATQFFMETPEVSSVYSEITKEISIKGAEHPFLKAAAEVLEKIIRLSLESLPTAVVFILTFVFVVNPVMQGTVRWSAYLIEMGKSLPIGAIMFYFTSPKLYFSSVYICIKLFVLKAGAAFLFMFPPTFCLFLGNLLGSDYYGQQSIAGVAVILSVIWFLLAVVLYMVFCQRYAAVRYLFALGSTKKLFRRSNEVTKDYRGWFFLYELRLVPNLLLVLAVFTAPLALSRIISAHCLAINELISKKRQRA